MKVKDNNNVSTLPTNPSPVLSSQEAAATQAVLVPDVVVPEKHPSGGDIEGDDEPNANPESGDDTEELKLEEDATKVSSLNSSFYISVLRHRFLFC